MSSWNLKWSCASVLVIGFLYGPEAVAGTTHRVPADFPTIQAAINAAAAGDTVLVADGTYTGPGNRDVDFGGKDLVVRSENGAARCVVDCQGTPAEPYRAFLFMNGETRKARLQGFTITGGSTLLGAIADQFNGGGVFISGASPTIKDCVFRDNDCGCWGAALYCTTSARPLITGCLFDGNDSGDDGGGLFTWLGADPVVMNSVFINNTAPANGGAIAVFGGGGGITLVNVTMVGNSASYGSGIIDLGTNTVITNSIIWNNTGGPQFGNFGNAAVTFSDIEGGGIEGPGNFDLDPALATDGYHLLPGSPCVNAGDPSYWPAPGVRDIDGDDRRRGLRCDVGADELHQDRRGHSPKGF